MSAIGAASQDGTLDPSFGSGGIVETALPFPEVYATAIALQPDGRIVVAGNAVETYEWVRIVIVRYESDGSLDTSFGSGGVVEASFGDDRSIVTALRVLADGRLLIAGSAGPPLIPGCPPCISLPTNIGLARLNPDGSFDPTFGDNGRVMTSVSGDQDSISEMELLPDGRVIAVGSSTEVVFPYQSRGFIMRFNHSGAVDSTFGDQGIIWEHFGGDTTASVHITSTALMDDGGVLACGTTGALHRIGLSRRLEDGRLDSTFGSNGRVSTPISSYCNDVLVSRDSARSIYIAGWRGDVANTFAITLARLTSSGSLDVAFGSGGVVTTRIEDEDSGLYQIALQGDGKVVGGGWAVSPGSSDTRIAVVRYDLNGQLDPSFDGDGVATTMVGPRSSGVGIAIQPDGRLVVAGRSSPRSFVVVRYFNAPTRTEPTPDGDALQFAVAPNPARRSAAVTITTPGPEFVRLVVIDQLGREVVRLSEGPATQTTTYHVDTSGLSPGVYVVRLTTARDSQSRQLTIVR